MSAELSRLRADIAELDRTLVEILARRVDLARELGVLKRDLRVPTLDPGHEAAVVRRAAESARAYRLPDEEVRELFWRVVGLSRRAQMEEE